MSFLLTFYYQKQENKFNQPRTLEPSLSSAIGDRFQLDSSIVILYDDDLKY